MERFLTENTTNRALYAEAHDEPFVPTKLFDKSGMVHIVFCSNGDGTGMFYYSDAIGQPLSSDGVLAIARVDIDKYRIENSFFVSVSLEDSRARKTRVDAWKDAIRAIVDKYGESRVVIHQAVFGILTANREYMELVGFTRFDPEKTLVKTYGALKADPDANGWRLLNRYLGPKTRIVSSQNLEYRILVQSKDKDGLALYEDFDAVLNRRRKESAR